MELDLSGKKALVCGSSQGIGLAAAQELALLGAQLTLVARDAQKLEKAVQGLSGTGHEFMTVDFDEPSAVEQVAAGLAKQGPIHILVNNSGGPPGGPLMEASTQDFLDTFQRHLICNQIWAKALLPGMLREGYGRIINVISTSVKVPLPGLGVSNTVRGAVAAWAKTLSNEVAREGVTVNNVLPGATLTQRLEGIIQARSEKTGKPVEFLEKEMLSEIPAQRFAKAKEIAALIAFLASPAASYINGTSIPVDGGRTGSI